MARNEEKDKTRRSDGGDAAGADAARDDRSNTIIAIVLMAIFLTWIGCAIAVYTGLAI